MKKILILLSACLIFACDIFVDPVVVRENIEKSLKEYFTEIYPDFIIESVETGGEVINEEYDFDESFNIEDCDGKTIYEAFVDFTTPDGKKMTSALLVCFEEGYTVKHIYTETNWERTSE